MDFSQVFVDAILKEQNADTQLTEQLLKEHSPKRLAKLGLAVINLTVGSIRSGLGGKTLIELEPDAATNADPVVNPGSFKTGDIVKLDRMVADDDSLVEGVVTRIKQAAITVAVDDAATDDRVLAIYNNTSADTNRVWIVKLANLVTYKRMVSTMNKLAEMDSPNEIIRLLLGQRKYTPPGTVPKVEFFNQNLNPSQQRAIEFAMASDVLIVHGPPGTGKTYTLIELIKQLAFNRNERVLVCGPSNISVDTILERLSVDFNSDKKGKGRKKSRAGAQELVRVGHPARLLEVNLRHSLEVLSKSTGEGSGIVRDIEADIMQTLKDAKKCKRYGERRQLWAQVKELKRELRVREKKVVADLVGGARVVVATLHGAGARELAGAHFDTIIIDEVSQALEPQCWIPLVAHGGFLRLVIAGDNMQLSPMLKLDAHVLEHTLFDRMMAELEGALYKRMLTVQYRMNQRIMEFPARTFYGGDLTAHESVRDIVLSQLPKVAANETTTTVCLWYDTQGGDFPEQVEEDGMDASKYNEREVEVVLEHIHRLREENISLEAIGVVSPYAAQVALLKKELDPAIEVSTIDGFQGREKEIIIISMVRSNDSGEVGFLLDERRMNVAITRAKRHLCVVGDLEMMGRSLSRFLNLLAEYVEREFEMEYPT